MGNPPIPLQIGVYQGDPLSVDIFMNTLPDTLSTRGDLGFSLPSSPISINHLLYADDTCVIGNTPAACQHLLGMVERWLDWSLLGAKVPKCHSLGIQASTGRTMNPGLSIAGEVIPPVNDDSFKFLGMPVRVYNSNISAKTSLKEKLKTMLNAVDNSQVTRHQKLRQTWYLPMAILALPGRKLHYHMAREKPAIFSNQIS